MIRDVMQNAGLELFAEVGLILFLAGFVLAVVRVALMRKDESIQVGHLPLDDDQHESEVHR